MIVRARFHGRSTSLLVILIEGFGGHIGPEEAACTDDQRGHHRRQRDHGAAVATVSVHAGFVGIVNEAVTAIRIGVSLAVFGLSCVVGVACIRSRIDIRAVFLRITVVARSVSFHRVVLVHER